MERPPEGPLDAHDVVGLRVRRHRWLTGERLDHRSVHVRVEVHREDHRDTEPNVAGWRQAQLRRVDGELVTLAGGVDRPQLLAGVDAQHLRSSWQLDVGHLVLRGLTLELRLQIRLERDASLLQHRLEDGRLSLGNALEGSGDVEVFVGSRHAPDESGRVLFGLHGKHETVRLVGGHVDVRRDRAVRDVVGTGAELTHCSDRLDVDVH